MRAPLAGSRPTRAARRAMGAAAEWWGAPWESWGTARKIAVVAFLIAIMTVEPV